MTAEAVEGKIYLAAKYHTHIPTICTLQPSNWSLEVWVDFGWAACLIYVWMLRSDLSVSVTETLTDLIPADPFLALKEKRRQIRSNRSTDFVRGNPVENYICNDRCYTVPHSWHCNTEQYTHSFFFSITVTEWNHLELDNNTVHSDSTECKHPIDHRCASQQTAHQCQMLATQTETDLSTSSKQLLKASMNSLLILFSPRCIRKTAIPCSMKDTVTARSAPAMDDFAVLLAEHWHAKLSLLTRLKTKKSTVIKATINS